MEGLAYSVWFRMATHPLGGSKGYHTYSRTLVTGAGLLEASDGL